MNEPNQESIIERGSKYEVELTSELNRIRARISEMGPLVSSAQVLEVIDAFAPDAPLDEPEPAHLIQELLALSRSEQLDVVQQIFPKGWRLALSDYVKRIEATARLATSMSMLLNVIAPDDRAPSTETAAQSAAIVLARYALKSWEEVGKGELPKSPVLDGCMFCGGAKGGVPGNENRIGDVVICDYCHALLMRSEGNDGTPHEWWERIDQERLLDAADELVILFKNPEPGREAWNLLCESAVENMRAALTGGRAGRTLLEQVMDVYVPKPGECICWKCLGDKNVAMMVVCPTCGNKRCPKASDHELECTNSNEPGQPGSIA